MIGDGINDIPALKRADIGIAMSSGAPAARAVARMVVVDGRFARLPTVVAEGRRVLANIERVSMLFFTKTTWAAALAVLTAVFVVGFPFLPRQLSVLDGLTIGLPAFLLALLPNARPYRVGFLRRSLAFAVPAGLAIALTLIAFAAGAWWLGVPAVGVRTSATLILGVAGLWVLALLCRPFGVREAAVLLLMAAGLAGVFLVRPVREFLELAELSPTAWLVATGFAAAAIGLIELGRHRRAWAR
jgi:cation-transporting ATPase E